MEERREQNEAFVTLATNDTYALGCLVLGSSLRNVGTTRQLVVMVTDGVSEGMKEQLRNLFDQTVPVNVLDSSDTCNLELLGRPDLSVTFTKFHCWRLTQYKKCVFMDADTLVIQNVDDLFDREELSAAPDAGWPDCFNSGVFVFVPSDETYRNLLAFAITSGSFDGGDQGLLNLYFRGWATEDIKKHLPFTYNVVSQAFYSYLPAFKQFYSDIKIVHFIGAVKPWHHSFNTTTRTVTQLPNTGHSQEFLQLWWDIFMTSVQPKLDPEMSLPQQQQGGIVGELASMTLQGEGSVKKDDRERKLQWEQGQADYMGVDRFDNIKARLDEKMSKPPSDTKLAGETHEEPKVSIAQDVRAAPVEPQTSVVLSADSLVVVDSVADEGDAVASAGSSQLDGVTAPVLVSSEDQATIVLPQVSVASREPSVIAASFQLEASSPEEAVGETVSLPQVASSLASEIIETALSSPLILSPKQEITQLSAVPPPSLPQVVAPPSPPPKPEVVAPAHKPEAVAPPSPAPKPEAVAPPSLAPKPEAVAPKPEAVPPPSPAPKPEAVAPPSPAPKPAPSEIPKHKPTPFSFKEQVNQPSSPKSTPSIAPGFSPTSPSTKVPPSVPPKPMSPSDAPPKSLIASQAARFEKPAPTSPGVSGPKSGALGQLAARFESPKAPAAKPAAGPKSPTSPSAGVAPASKPAPGPASPSPAVGPTSPATNREEMFARFGVRLPPPKK